MSKKDNRKLGLFLMEKKFKAVVREGEEEHIVDYCINVLGVDVPLFKRDDLKIDEEMVKPYIDTLFIRSKLLVLALLADWYKVNERPEYYSLVKAEANKLRRLKQEKILYPDAIVDKIITTFNSKKNLRKSWL